MQNIELSSWITTVLDATIVIILVIEYRYDKAKDDVKKQRKTRTSKKTTNQNGSIIEEQTEEIVDYNNGTKPTEA